MEYNEYKFFQKKKLNLNTDLVMIFYLLQDGYITVCCTMARASRGPSDLTGASWSRTGLAMVPLFSGSILPKPLDLDAIWCYLFVSGCWRAQQLQTKSTAKRSRVSSRLTLRSTHSNSVTAYFCERESTAAGSGYETCIQSALQHFQHCFLIPLAWIEFGSEFCGVGVGLIWIDAHPQIKWLRERSPGLPTW